MSTKIYDGKKLPNMSVLELHRFCQKLKAELLPVAKTEYCKLVAKIAQSAYMYMVTGQNICDYTIDMPNVDIIDKRNDPYGIFSFAREQANKLVLNTSAAIRRVDSEPEADFDVSICVFPIHDKTLCIPFANHDELHKKLFETKEFEEYGYWNNVDAPKGVSDEEWARRKADWDEALPGIGVPRDCGMLFKIIDAPYDVIGKILITVDDILPHFISDEGMCEKFAGKIVFEREFQKAIEPYGKDWMQHGYSSLRKAQKYVEEHRDEVNNIADGYRDVVKCEEFFKKRNEN